VGAVGENGFYLAIGVIIYHHALDSLPTEGQFFKGHKELGVLEYEFLGRVSTTVPLSS
jgi:hypothetical protein